MTLFVFIFVICLCTIIPAYSAKTTKIQFMVRCKSFTKSKSTETVHYRAKISTFSICNVKCMIVLLACNSKLIVYFCNGKAQIPQREKAIRVMPLGYPDLSTPLKCQSPGSFNQSNYRSKALLKEAHVWSGILLNFCSLDGSNCWRQQFTHITHTQCCRSIKCRERGKSE